MKHLKEIMISLYHHKWLKYGIVTIVAILLLGDILGLSIGMKLQML